MVQSRRPAGTPVGGQFAAVNRPGASLSLVDGESGTVHDTLIELDRDGARQVARYEAVGSICAHLPAATRRVAEDAAAGVGVFGFDSVEQLADVALRYSARLNGLNDEAYDRLMRCLPSQMSTDIWRAARHHAREVVAELAGGAPTTSAPRAHPDGTSHQAAPARSGDWVCPVDASHETAHGRCAECGVVGIANGESTESVPPLDAPEEGRAFSTDSAAPTGVPVKAERVLRELVSEFYRLQNDADDGNDDDMAEAFDRAAAMLEATITDAFSGHSPSENRIGPARIDWSVCGDPDGPGGEQAQMLGTALIGSIPFHVLALQVEGGDVQRALQRDDDLGMAMNALGDQAPYETVEVEGREYVLLLSPHGR
ncbi:MAG: hypothetical protein ACYCR4_05655 [Acidimicrobiales bacterium]